MLNEELSVLFESIWSTNKSSEIFAHSILMSVSDSDATDPGTPVVDCTRRISVAPTAKGSDRQRACLLRRYGTVDRCCPSAAYFDEAVASALCSLFMACLLIHFTNCPSAKEVIILMDRLSPRDTSQRRYLLLYP